MSKSIITISNGAFILNFLISVYVRWTWCAQSDYNLTNYCKLKCKLIYDDSKQLDNSACDCSRGSNCGDNIHIVTPTEESRQSIVDVHNTLRENVASGNEERGQNKGGVTNMFAMVYDHSLEYVAECWAKKCIFETDRCPRTERFESVGQNDYSTSVEDCNDEVIIKALYAWYEEIVDVTLGCVLGYRDCIAADHYTQMMWANTTHVGCAAIEISSKTCNVFCNYGPAGNRLGEPLYTIGPPGYQCIARHPVYRSLCAPQNNIQLQIRADQAATGSKLSKSIFLLFFPFTLTF